MITIHNQSRLKTAQESKSRLLSLPGTQIHETNLLLSTTGPSIHSFIVKSRWVVLTCLMAHNKGANTTLEPRCRQPLCFRMQTCEQLSVMYMQRCGCAIGWAVCHMQEHCSQSRVLTLYSTHMGMSKPATQYTTLNMCARGSGMHWAQPIHPHSCIHVHKHVMKFRVHMRGGHVHGKLHSLTGSSV